MEVDSECSEIRVPGVPIVSEKKGYLVKIEPLQKLIECAIISPYIKGEKPISLLIAATPESGKTAALILYSKVKGVTILTDATAHGINQHIVPRIKSGETKTIIIPDLLTPLSKQTKTRRGFIAFLNNLTEEGVGKIVSNAFVQLTDDVVTANIITAVTKGAILDARRGWTSMGFLSRFIFFSYSYSESVVYEIMNRYSEFGLEKKEVKRKAKLKLPRGKVDIKLSKEMADKIDPIARRIGEIYDGYGIRAKINSRCLLKCLAYRNGRKEVTEEEFREFIELADYMNLDFSQIGGVIHG
jgi:hypothetical protein